ncbi:MAG: choice-of-anchor J domain-containing protein [Bacteroidia bacterium]
MLKHILLTISALAFLALVQTANAQSTLFSEDFTNGIPATWTILDGDGNTPSPDWPNSSLSGCNAYPVVQGWEGYCGNAMSISWYSPAGQSDDWLFTPAITIPANANNVYLRFTASTITTQRQQNYRDDYAVRIGTSTTPADHVPNLLHNSNDPTFEAPIIDISGWKGQTVYISFQNYANNEYALLVDNVEVIILPEKEIIAEEIKVRAYSDGKIKGTFTNFGSATITDAEVNYQIAGGPVVTATVTGLNIASFETAEITHPTQYTGGGLKANIRYWVSKVNGGADANPNDNELTKIGSNFAYTTSHKMALVETFTSSTCPPCRPGNIQLESILGQMNDPNIVAISNQVPWINTRDPYGTNETDSRAGSYYGITGVPHTVVDGSVTRVNPNGIETTDISPALEEAGFVDFDGTFRN